ncbi:M14 family zinc carboxypeptidase [Mycolicibacterium diernhoferi]|uniref:M14 family zinc carboxypeptidase n=2 Tax=Mycolicibacterium diernhoferi TaxID=1801 RepID=UPI000938C2BA|nr:M14 family zinc carboxypeptidase [Mycolicibacterium diernhoferi]QYL21779.1 succinylglutamate desuccinylase/aspartoacylase family protein [Mycolicibacterium diernhoferi]
MLKIAVSTLTAGTLIVGCGSTAGSAIQATTSQAAAPYAAETAAPSRTIVVGRSDWEQVGTSVQGRPIRARTVGHGPRAVLFIGGIHGDETEGEFTTDQLPAAFEAAGLADRVALTILEDANPDGRAAGTRGNANGIDVNRNFPATNFDGTDPANGKTPLSQPESRAVAETIDRIEPSVVIAFHAWAGDQFINFDGPARSLAEQFSSTSGFQVKASSEFAPTPGSLGSYAGRDRGIPVLSIEVLKGADPQVTWDRLRFALLQVIVG